jgi:glycosyltransferase involved in cell wall biosynthesis
MELLFVLENYAPHVGGVETVFKTLCEGLVADGHRVTVVTHHIPGTSLREVVNGVQVQRVRCFDSRYLFTFAAIPAVVRLANAADIVHTTTFNAAPPAWLAARIRGKPVLLTVHETWLGKWREYSNFGPVRAWVHDLLERLVFLPRFDRYACVSKSTARQLATAKPKIAERVMTVYNGFDPSPWRPTRATPAATKSLRKRLGLTKRFVVLGYGRPGTSKGFEHLVRAFPAIKKAIPNAALVLVLNTAPQYAAELRRLKEMAASMVSMETENDDATGITFLPSQRFPDLVTHIQLADCVVVPSLTEGFGYAALEAASAGVPVVATDGTSIPEVACGAHVLVPARDPAAIARGVVRVHDGKARRTPLRKFPWWTTIEAYEKIYRELLRDDARERRD